MTIPTARDVVPTASLNPFLGAQDRYSQAENAAYRVGLLISDGSISVEQLRAAGYTGSDPFWQGDFLDSQTMHDLVGWFYGPGGDGPAQQLAGMGPFSPRAAADFNTDQAYINDLTIRELENSVRLQEQTLGQNAQQAAFNQFQLLSETSLANAARARSVGSVSTPSPSGLVGALAAQIGSSRQSSAQQSQQALFDERLNFEQQSNQQTLAFIAAKNAMELAFLQQRFSLEDTRFQAELALDQARLELQQQDQELRRELGLAGLDIDQQRLGLQQQELEASIQSQEEANRLRRGEIISQVALGGDPITREFVLRGQAAPTGTPVNVFTGEVSGAPTTFPELRAEQADLLRPFVATGGASPLAAPETLPPEEGGPVLPEPPAQAGGTREREFIVGDHVLGLNNPELVQIENPGPNTKAHVVPLKPDVAQLGLQEGTEPRRYQGGTEEVRLAVHGDPTDIQAGTLEEILSRTDLGGRPVFQFNPETGTLTRTADAINAQRQANAREFGHQQGPGVQTIDPYSAYYAPASALIPQHFIDQGRTQSIAPNLPGYTPPPGFPTENPNQPQQVGLGTEVELTPPAQGTAEFTTGLDAPGTQTVTLPETNPVFGAPNQGGYSAVTSPGTVTERGATFDLQAGDYRGPNGQYYRWNDQAGAYIPLTPAQTTPISTIQDFFALSPEEQIAARGEGSGYVINRGVFDDLAALQNSGIRDTQRQRAEQFFAERGGPTGGLLPPPNAAGFQVPITQAQFDFLSPEEQRALLSGEVNFRNDQGEPQGVQLPFASRGFATPAGQTFQKSAVGIPGAGGLLPHGVPTSFAGRPEFREQFPAFEGRFNEAITGLGSGLPGNFESGNVPPVEFEQFLGTDTERLFSLFPEFRPYNFRGEFFGFGNEGRQAVGEAISQQRSARRAEQARAAQEAEINQLLADLGLPSLEEFAQNIAGDLPEFQTGTLPPPPEPDLSTPELLDYYAAAGGAPPTQTTATTQVDPVPAPAPAPTTTTTSSPAPTTTTTSSSLPKKGVKSDPVPGSAPVPSPAPAPEPTQPQPAPVAPVSPPVAEDPQGGAPPVAEEPVIPPPGEGGPVLPGPAPVADTSATPPITVDPDTGAVDITSGATLPDLSVLSFGPEVFNAIPSIQFLRGDIGRGQFLTPGANAPVDPILGVNLPAPNALNYGTLLDIIEAGGGDLLAQIFAGSNRSLANELMLSRLRAPLGSAVQSSLIETGL